MFTSGNIKKRYKDIVYLMRVVHSSFKLEYFKIVNEDVVYRSGH